MHKNMSEEKTISDNNQEPKKEETAKKDDSKLCAALAYLVFGVIWYFADEELKKNDFAKFHVKQALVLFAFSIVGSFALSLIIFIGWIIMPFFGLATVVLAIIGIINALNGDKKELPVIGAYAARFFKF
jgi:uncharacterized membrane protein